MEVRKSTANDMNEILSIYDSARAYMVTHGNPTQWQAGYPGEDVLAKDIANGDSYVITADGTIVGTFSFIIGEEPTYQIIENGEWNYNKPYGTIHRVASNGIRKGVAAICFDYCSRQIDYMRIDTHEDNLAMQNAIGKYGFQKCGIVYVRDGTRRIAFDYMRAKKEK